MSWLTQRGLGNVQGRARSGDGSVYVPRAQDAAQAKRHVGNLKNIPNKLKDSFILIKLIVCFCRHCTLQARSDVANINLNPQSVQVEQRTKSGTCFLPNEGVVAARWYSRALAAAVNWTLNGHEMVKVSTAIRPVEA